MRNKTFVNNGSFAMRGATRIAPDFTARLTIIFAPQELLPLRKNVISVIHLPVIRDVCIFISDFPALLYDYHSLIIL